MPAGKLTLMHNPSKSTYKVPRLRKYRKVFLSKALRARARYLTKSSLNPTNRVSVFPERYSFIGRWCKASGLASAAVQNTFGLDTEFNLNSIYAPENGVGTHAMLGWTELDKLYRKYKVRGVKVSLKITNSELDGLAVGMWFQTPGAVNNLSGKTLQQVREKNDVFVKYSNDSGGQVQTFNKYFPIHKLCGITKMEHETNTRDYAALMLNNPANHPTLKIACVNTADTQVKSVAYTLVLTFYGYAYERKMMSISDPTL